MQHRRALAQDLLSRLGHKYAAPGALRLLHPRNHYLKRIDPLRHIEWYPNPWEGAV